VGNIGLLHREGESELCTSVDEINEQSLFHFHLVAHGRRDALELRERISCLLGHTSEVFEVVREDDD
jgi:hypothetical protein